MATIPERVAAGAEFLDEHDPDWWRADVEHAIDLGTLDLAQERVCVLGQRCPLEAMDPYIAFGRMLSGRETGWRIDDWARPLGSQADGNSDDYEHLTAEWKRVIARRRAES